MRYPSTISHIPETYDLILLLFFLEVISLSKLNSISLDIGENVAQAMYSRFIENAVLADADI